MPKVVPSQIVEVIDMLYGASRNELSEGMLTPKYQAEVHALLSLLDEVPGDLIDLRASDYLEYIRCRAVLATALASWNLGAVSPARQVGGRDVVARIRVLMKQCHDELPSRDSDLAFILNLDIRFGIEDRIRAAWTDYAAHEWMGATVFAAAALEALLLWAIKQVTLSPSPKKGLNDLHLAELIHLATINKVIDEGCSQQALLAKDARNLIHPGNAQRLAESCSKTTALTALTAVYRVIDCLKAR